MNKRRKTNKTINIFLITMLMTAFCLGCAKKEEAKKEIPFAAPGGMTVSEEGLIYVVDIENNNVLRMENEKTWHVAGKTLPLNAAGVAQGGYADGSLAEAVFNRPYGIVPWGEDGFAVSDMSNHCIRLVNKENVRTLAGTGLPGCHNDRANLATFNEPAGMAVDKEGYLYIADSGNGTVRCLSTDGQVFTVAEGLNKPMDLCWYEEELYIADAGAHQILKIDSSGNIVEVAGISYEEEDVERKDGPAEEATFCAPHGIEIIDGVIYVADTGFSAIRKIEDGMVTTLKYSEGTGKDLWPSRPIDIIKYDEKLYVSDAFHSAIFTIKLHNT